MREDPSLAKLDRIMVSSMWEVKYLSIVSTYNRITLVRVPLCLVT